LPSLSVRVVQIRRTNEEEPIKAKSFGPLTYVAWLGFILSAMLLGISIHWRDGMSIISTVLLSLLSSLIGLGNYWKLKLPKRVTKSNKNAQGTNTRNWLPGSPKITSDKPSDEEATKEDIKAGEDCEAAVTEQGENPKKPEDHAPPGDVVIRYPKGNFLVVRCHEDVARELYFAPEEIEYLIQDAWIYRLLSLVGTMMLMGGVICLANARIESQIAWAGSYMLLGAAYWIVAALPQKIHWDTSCYEVIPEALADSIAHTKTNLVSKSRKYPYSKSKTFTEALWKAIVASKDTDWVRRKDHCPHTVAWDEWLQEAKDCTTDFWSPMEEEDKDADHKGNGLTTWAIPPWDPSANLQRILKKYKDIKARAKS
jgi:hypothetical protein